MGVWKKGSLAVSRQRVIRAKTLERGAELHREETERVVRSSGSLVSSLSTVGPRAGERSRRIAGQWLRGRDST